MKKMRVVLILIYSDKMLQNLDDVGIGYIGAYLRNHGYEVLIVGSKENKIDFEVILEFNPDIIGIPVYREALEGIQSFCKEIKKLIPSVKLCLGGVLATYYDDELMAKINEVDYIIRGEGEKVMHNLLRCLETNGNIRDVNGVTYRLNGIVFKNQDEGLIEDLNKIPFPSRDIVNNNRLSIAAISTTRGCYGKCTFCDSPAFWRAGNNHKWRGKTIKSLVDELEHISTNFGVVFFDIGNNSFEDPGSSYDRVIEFAEEIIRRKLVISYTFAIRSVFQRKITEELMGLLKKSGLSDVFIGIESANEQDLKLFGKIGNVLDNIKAVEKFRKAGINTTIGFINLHPYSTFEAQHDNIKFLSNYGYAGYFIMLQKLIVDKGSNLYQKFKKENLLLDGGVENGYSYKYRDVRIKNLVDFLDGYFIKSEQGSPLIQQLKFYERSYMQLLSYSERCFMYYDDSKPLLAVTEAKNKINEIVDEINRRNYIWYTRLLDIAENHWDSSLANHIVNKYMSYEFMNELFKELLSVRNALNRKYMRLGSKYEKYIQ